MKAQLLIAIAGFAALASAQAQMQVKPDSGPFEVIHVRPRIYMLATASGNVVMQMGDAPADRGLVLVDTGAPSMTARTLSEIHKITSKPVLFIINTSADAHHTGANRAISQPAPAQGITRGAGTGEPVAIFAQDNVLARESAPGSGVPVDTWPTITYEGEKDFPSNGEPVQIIAEKSAHTDGDSIVVFRNSNVVATGDIFRTTGYPVIDLKRGGSIQGELKALNHILDITVPAIMQEGGTMVIPGQGRLCDESDVVDYRDMVTIIRDRVADMLKRGKTLAEVKAAGLSADFDGRFSTPAWSGSMFIEAIYKSLDSKSPGQASAAEGRSK